MMSEADMRLMRGLMRILPLYAVLLVIPVLVAYANQSINATVRDFQSVHPDFEDSVSGVVNGLVGSTLPLDKKPVFVRAPGAGAITDASTFAQWYTDVAGINMITTLPLTLTETAPGSGIFEFNDQDFFPIDGSLFGNEGLSHNYHFTLELHTSFTYQSGQTFHFSGDDDLWVYINDQLVVDLGGVHGPVNALIDFYTLGLTPGNTYDFDLYFAERHTPSSVFQIQTSIVFNPNPPDIPPSISRMPEGKAPNLVVLVHGCCTDANGVKEWDDLGRLILEKIPNTDEWEVVVWDWTKCTPDPNVECTPKPTIWQVPPFKRAADIAYTYALSEGRELEVAISNYSYEYVHLIAHSARAKLIDEAALQIALNNIDQPFLHITFLDAYTRDDNDKINYGGLPVGYPRYVEHYVDRGLPYTNTCLLNAFNFDISKWSHFPWEGGELGHQWPRRWYEKSVTSTSPQFKYGYPLSLEGSGKDIDGLVNELAQYPAGQQCGLDTGLFNENPNPDCQPAACWE
jgi:fibro-slime domain-containing protein